MGSLWLAGNTDGLQTITHTNTRTQTHTHTHANTCTCLWTGSVVGVEAALVLFWELG